MRTAFFAALALAGSLAVSPRPDAAGGAGQQGDPGSRPARSETRHLVLTIPPADVAAAPGARISLRLDIAPKPGMHVYAPGQKELIPISLSLVPGDTYKVHAATFPRPEKYVFEPLNETQLVYSKPFRILQVVTIADTPATRARAQAAERLTISGTLRYQACDNEVCYMPETLPVSWEVPLKPKRR